MKLVWRVVLPSWTRNIRGVLLNTRDVVIREPCGPGDAMHCLIRSCASGCMIVRRDEWCVGGLLLKLPL